MLLGYIKNKRKSENVKATFLKEPLGPSTRI